MYSTMLRWPGGKSVALKHMLPYFPDDWDAYIEPFIGGGSVFLQLKQWVPKRTFWINDKYKSLIEFWQMVREYPAELVDYLLKEKASSKISPGDEKNYGRDVFEKAQKLIVNGHDLERAASFYVINKCSFSGLTESSSFAPQAFIQNFSVACIRRLVEYHPLLDDVRITNWSYSKVLKKIEGKKPFVYGDPPYDLGECFLYGKGGKHHSTFDHDEFAADVKALSRHVLWILSYNDTPRIRKLYEGYRIQELSWKYTMRVAGKDGVKGRTGKRGNEILIFSNNIKPPAQQQELL